MYYHANLIEKIAIERAKAVDGMILGEIKQIAVENGIDTKIVLNEKKIVEALSLTNGAEAIIQFLIGVIAWLVGCAFFVSTTLIGKWIVDDLI